jgi:serine/threonine protein kinase
MGSSAYMAPEQFEHLPLDYLTDIYSLGCVFYYSLSGILPFDGDDPAAIMNRHLNHTVKHLHERRPEIPKVLCNWVMWLINRYREDRPESAKEGLLSFRQLVRSLACQEQTSIVSLPETESLTSPMETVEGDPNELGEKTKPVSFMVEPNFGNDPKPRSAQAALVGLALTVAVVGLIAFFLIPRADVDGPNSNESKPTPEAPITITPD